MYKAAALQRVRHRKHVAELARILDRLQRRALGLVEKSLAPETDRVEGARAHARVVPAEIIGVIAVALAVVEADDFARRLAHAGEIRHAQQHRHLGVIGLEQQVGIVELARDREQLIGELGGLVGAAAAWSR